MAMITSKPDIIELVKQEINGLINCLTKSLKAINRINSKRDKRIRDIKEEAARKIIKQRKITEETGGEIYKIFKANKALLTENGRNQTLELELGKIGIRLNRPSVWVKNIQQNIEKLKNSSGTIFVRKKEEYFLDKVAIAASASLFDKMEDFSITLKEVFFVKPIAIDKEYRKDIKRIRLNKKAIKKKD